MPSPGTKRTKRMWGVFLESNMRPFIATETRHMAFECAKAAGEKGESTSVRIGSFVWDWLKPAQKRKAKR